jgi:DNA-binding response OmpR family regulator
MPMAKKILVVNDSEEILDLFGEILRDEGYEPILHGLQVRDLKPVVEIKPDLVIVDQLFGEEVRGWKLIQLMRMSRQTAHIPIIVCSTELRKLQELDGHLRSLQIEAIPKPFLIDDLLEAINRAFSRATPPPAGIFSTNGKPKVTAAVAN